jgi:hypothetical protein
VARRWDQNSKHLVAAGLEGLLDRLGIEVGERLEPCTVELPASAHRADLVFATSGGRVVHVEVQQSPDPDMGRRMVEYAARIAGRSPGAGGVRDLVQIVFQVSGRRMPSRYRLGRLTNDVTVVHVPTTPPEELLAVPPLAPFALVPGGAAAAPRVVEAITRTTDADLGSAMSALAVDLAGEFRVLSSPC